METTQLSVVFMFPSLTLSSLTIPPPLSAISLSRFLALLLLSVTSIATPQAGSITTQRDAMSFSHCIRKKRVAMPNLISASFRGDVACAALIFKIRKTNMLIRAEFQNISLPCAYAIIVGKVNNCNLNEM